MSEKTSTGLEENVASLLCYLLFWISGLAFFLIEKENATIKFHAMQSMVLFGGLHLAGFVLVVTLVGAVLVPLLYVIGVVLWIILMIKAYQGEKYKLPVIGDLAEKWAQDVKI
ncbi:DUF4870 domain-containing protein [Emcibacter sp.]|uniref:DUF4870 domain-containing protein n=1 Tax=Emcibacter sp. TaxID=1979954 RepID=UPI003A8F3757